MSGRPAISRSAALSTAIMLAAAFQFLALSVVLSRPEFGWRDVAFSMISAAGMSFVVSAVFCVPTVLRVTAIGPVRAYFISYIVGFFTVTLFSEMLTTIFLGWPLDEHYRLSLEETLIGAMLITILATPLAALGAVIIGAISWLIPSVRPGCS